MTIVASAARDIAFALSLGSSMVCAAQSVGQIPLPQIEEGARVELRVAYVYNPRLQQLSSQQLEQLLAETTQYAANHFNVDLVYRDLDVVAIDTLFHLINRDVARDQMLNAYPFRDPENPQKSGLVDSVENCLARLTAPEFCLR